jgi:Fe-S-cluster-containing hydrogenase component 2
VAINVEQARYVPVVCLQCDDAPCIEQCPTGALVRDPDTSAVIVVAENCDGCGECERACPYGAIRVWEDLAHKCDLCGGDPECVRFCAPGALRYEPRAAWPEAQRQAYADHLQELAQEVNA